MGKMKLEDWPRGRRPFFQKIRTSLGDLSLRKAVSMYFSRRTGLEEPVSGHVQNFARPLVVVGSGGLSFPFSWAPSMEQRV